jgi:alkanesulfonate monooxygenase SsuD/methylene tetrahydromethanopterin reductase-like flavin-dependent oxidoreductase (luciferase family)
MSEIKFGNQLPLTSIDRCFRVAKLSEEAGFDFVFVPDHTLKPLTEVTFESWTVLTAISMITKKIKLETVVSCPHRCHPAVFAQRLATLDQISGGRVILGIGAGEAMNLDPFGIEWKYPVSKMKEAIEIMKRLWNGETFSYNGRFYRLKDAFLQIKPAQETIPIYIGANSPETRRLAGRIADGWIPFPESPESYKLHFDDVKRGLKEAGRSLEEIDPSLQVLISISEDSDEAYRTLDNYKMILATPIPTKLTEISGIQLPPKYDHDWWWRRLLATPEGEKEYLELNNLIPRDVAIECSIAGTLEDCIQKIERYIKAGVRTFNLINIGPDARKVNEMCAKEIIPYFKQL